MEAKEFENFLHEQIPITKAMSFSVLEFSSKKVRLKAKLEPNINHKSTAFGGSINSLLTICGWAMVYANIKTLDSTAHIVVHKSSINYLAPINDDFTAECILDDENIINSFFNSYVKHKKGRLKLNVACISEEKVAAEYVGQYVAFRQPKP
jgi:thioesterase domain-containing protein